MHCATLCCKAAPKDTESKLIISDVGSSSNCLCYQDINHWEVKSCHRNGWSLSQQSVVSSLSLQQKLLSWIPPIKTFKIEKRFTWNQSHYREVRGGRFLWNRNWDLGWIWAGSATFEASFFMFSWAKKNSKNIVDSENKSGIEWS